MRDPFLKSASLEGPAEETIQPEPSAEQNELWNKIDSNLDPDIMDRELKFLELLPEEQERLASIELAEDIARVAERTGIDSETLAQIMRYVAIKDMDVATGIRIGVEGLEAKDERKALIERELGALLSPKKEETGPEPFQEEVNTLQTLQNASLPPLNEAPKEEPKASEATPIPESPQPLEDKPFILHEENAPIFQQAPKNRPSVVFEPMSTERRTSSRPTTAKIQAPSPRVVHYSEMKTSLDQ